MYFTPNDLIWIWIIKILFRKRSQCQTKLKFYIKGEPYKLDLVQEWLAKSANACFNRSTIIVHSIWFMCIEVLVIFDAREFKIGLPKQSIFYQFQSIQLNKRWYISSNPVRRTCSISWRIERADMRKFILVDSPEEIWSVRFNRRRVQGSKIDILFLPETFWFDSLIKWRIPRSISYGKN